MHETETEVQQPNRFKQAGLVAAASVIGGLGALVEVAAGEARRRHRGKHNHRDNDRKEERREDRREERRDDRQDDRDHDRQHSRATGQEEHPRHEAAASNGAGGGDEGGNNHDPEQIIAAAPVPGSGRAPSRLDYDDQPHFLS